MVKHGGRIPGVCVCVSSGDDIKSREAGGSSRGGVEEEGGLPGGHGGCVKLVLLHLSLTSHTWASLLPPLNCQSCQSP